MDADLQDTEATRGAIAFVVAAGDACGNNLSGKRYGASEEEPRGSDGQFAMSIKSSKEKKKKSSSSTKSSVIMNRLRLSMQFH